MSKAFNGIPPSLCDKQFEGPSSLPVVVARRKFRTVCRFIQKISPSGIQQIYWQELDQAESLWQHHKAVCSCIDKLNSAEVVAAVGLSVKSALGIVGGTNLVSYELSGQI